MTYSTELKNRPPPKPNARHAYRNSFGTFVWFRVNSLAVPSQQTTIFLASFASQDRRGIASNARSALRTVDGRCSHEKC
jgi:hypothetical protein